MDPSAPIFRSAQGSSAAAHPTQGPSPLGDISTSTSTLMGWSSTTVDGRVTEYTSSHIFHKEGEQPDFAINEAGEMTVSKGKGKGKEMTSWSSWRRFSDSGLADGVVGVGGLRNKVVRSEGWSMVDMNEWAREEERAEEEEQHREERRVREERALQMPLEGSVSKENLLEGSEAKGSSLEDSTAKNDGKKRYQEPLIVCSSMTKRPIENETEFFMPPLSRKDRKEIEAGKLDSLLAKHPPWVGAVSSLAHPIVFDPDAVWEMLPHETYSHASAQCAVLGQYLARPKAPKPTHPWMTSKYFTIIIRGVGRFDRSGFQPGLIIRTAHFRVSQLTMGFVPGERKVEIWRNGETLKLFGLIAVIADGCAWFLRDDQLRWGEGFTEEEEEENLALGVGLGQP